MAKNKRSEPEQKDRGSLYLTPDAMWKLKYIALMDQTTQTSIIEEALTDYFNKWEKKNGPVPKKA